MLTNAIEEIVVRLSENPLNPNLNYLIGCEYDQLGQTAAATGFYLRAAEYGADSSDLTTTYKALLKIASCMDRQKDRAHTSKSSLQQAIALLPERPEAYFLLAQHYERKGAWQDCYTTSSIGLLANNTPGLKPLGEDFGYHDYVLSFELAVSAWWLGRRTEAVSLFEGILSRKDEVDPAYIKSCRDNLEKIK